MSTLSSEGEPILVCKVKDALQRRTAVNGSVVFPEIWYPCFFGQIQYEANLLQNGLLCNQKRVSLLILRYKLTEALGIIFIFIPKIFAASIPEQRGNLLSTIQPLTNGVDAR